MACKQKTRLNNKMRNLQAWTEILAASKDCQQFMDTMETVISVLSEAVTMARDYQQGVPNGKEGI